jgi:hypothetical protein
MRYFINRYALCIYLHMNNLQQRVNMYLSGRPPEYPADDANSEVAVVDSLFSMLQTAEGDLQAAQGRVERLKWQLAKAKE